MPNLEYAGYIALHIVPSKKNNKRECDITDLILKTLDKNTLPYNTFYEESDAKFEGGRTVNDKRQNVSQILLRSDYITPSAILEQGGFQPHCLPKSDQDPQEGNYHKVPEAILSPFTHSINSSQTGSVSCTTSMSMIKKYSANDYAYPHNYVYMVKAVGGFNGTNSRDVEKEVTVPGGIDSEDIIAFRRLENLFQREFYRGESVFDSQEPLYININFIRRYPDLLNYILDRYLENNEECPDAIKLIAEIPGTQSHDSLSVTTSLPDVKLAVLSILKEYTEDDHRLRIEQIKEATTAAKDVDDIWCILNNQFDLFETPDKSQGSILVPGLSAQFYSRGSSKFDNGAQYCAVIQKALSILPRVDPLADKHKKIDCFEKDQHGQQDTPEPTSLFTGNPPTPTSILHEEQQALLHKHFNTPKNGLSDQKSQLTDQLIVIMTKLKTELTSAQLEEMHPFLDSLVQSTQNFTESKVTLVDFKQQSNNILHDKKFSDLKTSDSFLSQLHSALILLFRSFFRIFDFIISDLIGAEHTMVENPGRHAFFNYPETALNKDMVKFTQDFTQALDDVDKLISFIPGPAMS